MLSKHIRVKDFPRTESSDINMLPAPYALPAVRIPQEMRDSMGRLNVRFDAQSLREMFFNCQGRLNRKPFILRLFGVIFFCTFVAILLYTLFYSGFGSKTVADGAAIVISIVEVIAILQPFFFRLIADLPEDSMEAQVVQALNLFTILLIVCLMLIRGKHGPNQYGEDPLEN